MSPDSATFGGDRRLAATRFGVERWVARTGSTNSDALALARDGAAEGVVMVADFQEGGRGRRGRSWVAPAGSSLLVSVLLRPPGALAGLTTTTAGVAMAEAVEQVTGVFAGLKWPNDLLVAEVAGGAGEVRGAGGGGEPGLGGVGRTGEAGLRRVGGLGERKLGGILAETDWPAGANILSGWREPAVYERVAVVVGVGLNVNWPDPADASAGDELPAEVLDTATALNWIVGHDVDRAELLVTFLCRLEDHYGTMVRERSGASVLAAWRTRSLTLGRRVRVDLGVDDIEGTAVDVTDEGHLVVDTLDGTRRTLAAGEVVHLRAG